ncbi:MAG: hypothetical protein ACP5O8_00835 [Candidatus Aenigmatarchaeota archaeon]
MLKKFLTIFGIFLFSFVSYLLLNNPTAMSVSQVNPNFWLPLSISIVFLTFLIIFLGMNERELAEKVGILKKIREEEMGERLKEITSQYNLVKYLEELRSSISEAETFYQRIREVQPKGIGEDERMKVAGEIVENLYWAIENLKLGKDNKVIRYLDDARKKSEALGYKEFAEKLWLLQGKMEVTYNIKKMKLKEVYDEFLKPFSE